MNTKEKKYKCTNCNETNPEKFYDYLVSRCKECKITASKNRRNESSKEKEKKVSNKDNTKTNSSELITYCKTLITEQENMKNIINELREENRQMKILLQNFLQASK